MKRANKTILILTGVAGAMTCIFFLNELVTNDDVAKKRIPKGMFS